LLVFLTATDCQGFIDSFVAMF